MSSRPVIASLGAVITATLAALAAYILFTIKDLEPVAGPIYGNILVAVLALVGIATTVTVGCMARLASVAWAAGGEPIMAQEAPTGLHPHGAPRPAKLDHTMKAADHSLPDEGPAVAAHSAAPRTSEAEPEPASPASAELQVLVAEDNAVNQLVIRTLLRQLGVGLVLVETGAAAVEAWRAGAFDVILMDIQMPEMDGVAAAAAIRDLEAATGRRRTPIIALTANVMTHQVAEYRSVGIDACVPKPVDLKTLCSALEGAVSTTRAALNLPVAPPPTASGHADPDALDVDEFLKASAPTLAAEA